ncbi:MAG: exodeoxyribonuclease VII large subunit [Rickettsiales bacterium]|nr:exodeoxyribonuclease VII large subunit [Rickettsiales bacterium]
MQNNIPEFTVSEFSRAIKMTLEDRFGYVRIKGEVTGFKKASSGHYYFNLREGLTLLSAVCFKSSANNINFAIGDGLEIIVNGKITSYEGRSSYQIIVDKAEIAGIGAILEMLEKRKQKLLAEGFFDNIHKKPLPFMPKIIGIITSETGAVIEDIKNRITNRFPTHILLYPTLTQGEKSAEQIIEAIKYFNHSQQHKPEIIIIARGGGSLEDLMPFNDEALIKAVFMSKIPVISAIGHETDNSLLDLVADVRAPTPTASAEIAVPDFKEVQKHLNKIYLHCNQLLQQHYHLLENKLQSLGNQITEPIKIYQKYQDKLALLTQQIDYYILNYIGEANNKINKASYGFLGLNNNLDKFQQLIDSNFNNIKFYLNNYLVSSQKLIELNKFSSQSFYNQITNQLKLYSETLTKTEKSIFKILNNNINDKEKRLNYAHNLLESSNYRKLLSRGFAILSNSDQKIISSIEVLQSTKTIYIELNDGKIILQK